MDSTQAISAEELWEAAPKTDQVNAAVLLWACIQMPLGSNLHWYTGYPDLGLLWHSSVPPGLKNLRIVMSRPRREKKTSRIHISQFALVYFLTLIHIKTYVIFGT